MALTQITDVQVASPSFQNYMRQKQLERNSLITSGAVQTLPQLSDFLAASGVSVNMPSWKSITGDSDEVATDTTTELTAGKISSRNTRAARLVRTKGWAASDLSGIMAGEKPLNSLGDQIVGFWDTNMQRALVSQLTGIFLDNTANDSADMDFNIYSDVVSGSITAGMKISADAIIEAKYTMGDANKELSIMVAHSKVAKTLQLLEPNDFIPKSATQPFSTYMGTLVLEDDSMTVVAGTNSPAYHTYLLGVGSIGFGSSIANILPEEVERKAGGGNGIGTETVYTRRVFSLHPRGFDFLQASVAGATASNTELALAANWNRVYDRKEINIARLVSNA